MGGDPSKQQGKERCRERSTIRQGSLVGTGRNPAGDLWEAVPGAEGLGLWAISAVTSVSHWLRATPGPLACMPTDRGGPPQPEKSSGRLLMRLVFGSLHGVHGYGKAWEEVRGWHLLSGVLSSSSPKCDQHLLPPGIVMRIK